MMAVWTWFIGTRVGRWIVGLGAVLAAIGTALAIGWFKGKHAQSKTDQAKDAQSLADAAQQVVNDARIRAEVDNANAKLPDAGPQKVANADPATATGRLRTDGWMRDDTKTDG